MYWWGCGSFDEVAVSSPSIPLRVGGGGGTFGISASPLPAGEGMGERGSGARQVTLAFWFCAVARNQGREPAVHRQTAPRAGDLVGLGASLGSKMCVAAIKRVELALDRHPAVWRCTAWVSGY